jgi:hypothetical protein
MRYRSNSTIRYGATLAPLIIRRILHDPAVYVIVEVGRTKRFHAK